MIRVFLCEIATDSSAFIQDESIIILWPSSARPQQSTAPHRTDNNRDLTERVHCEKFGRLLLLGAQVNHNVLEGDLLFCQNKGNNGGTAACFARSIQFEHHVRARVCGLRKAGQWENGCEAYVSAVAGYGLLMTSRIVLTDVRPDWLPSVESDRTGGLREIEVEDHQDGGVHQSAQQNA